MQNNNNLDYKVISNIIKPKSSILDLGCGDGSLLYSLKKEKNAYVQGIELNEKAIYKCIEKGIDVFHGNIETGLAEYPNKSFDYVILNQSMQELKKVGFVLYETLRVGKKVIIGFPNFAYISLRFSLLLRGKAPLSSSLPYHWYDTPNLHFLSITDFRNFCLEKRINIENSFYLGKKKLIHFLPNLFAENTIFLISKKI